MTIPSILIIDDSAPQREHAARLCSESGIPVIYQANNGLEALDLLDLLKLPPSVLMVDLEMPGMDGVELIQALQLRNTFIPLIIASSRELNLISSVEAMLKALGHTSLGCLQKPIKAEALALVLDRYHTAPQVKGRGGNETAKVFTEVELLNAIANAQIVPYFQPKVEMKTGMIKGVEALARWVHPELGLIPPDQFIPAMEKSSNLIRLLTLAMAEQSVAQCASWNDRGLQLSVAINLSPMLLEAQDLFSEIARLPEQHGVPIKQITWEITESSVVTNVGSALGTLARLRLKGFGLSIDDYGTGFSSMQQLARIPFTELKIDQSFVNGASARHHLAVILHSAIHLAQQLDMVTVAEGVENIDDWRLLQSLGCTMAQGYFIAKPMPGRDIFPWLKEYHPRIAQLRSTTP